ncbi:MAG TPA: 16S rRNA (guanine(527)-N(7))-methyltransferase RsmG [Hyphomonadaceae bacterium]|nr:16S rRNA (guanine(527)-N(7))-methyltransferase RsmG [Hyphomonadaceae bacterium]
MSFPAADEDGFGPEEVIRATGVSHETLGKIRAYLSVLDRWRERINLIGPGEGRHLWRRHVLDSLQLVAQIDANEKEIADLGSGAGFPGLIVACAMAGRTGTTVTLVEKSPRKSEFLEAAIAELGLPGRVQTQRLEDKPPYRYDLITARALAPLPKLLGYGYQWLKPSGKALLMKGRDMAAELALARESWTFDLSVLPSASSPEGHVLKVSALSPRRA